MRRHRTRRLIRVYTFCHSSGNFYTQYQAVNCTCSNFRTSVVRSWGVRKLKINTVLYGKNTIVYTAIDKKNIQNIYFFSYVSSKTYLRELIHLCIRWIYWSLQLLLHVSTSEISILSSFFLSFFLSFFQFFSYSLNVLHCLAFIDDATYALCFQEMTQISPSAHRQILWHIYMSKTCIVYVYCKDKYSITSIARTRMARLPWMFRTRFSVPTKFFQ